ncbi:PREDICTED: uncharacterized protein LOC104282451 [Charadrius vociferus]|uniref:uncharacterized protein LOC104282451 n=1 Tax=Charadrius vociferus TaxID=50402 RepID=UPI00052133B4|nr:PREDICTED: uncharacterized protein LOC104282451 [Charadrius vociferus]
MAAAIALVLALLALQHGLKNDHQLDKATAQRMQQREEFLQQEMTRLLQEMEWRERPGEATLLSVWQQCLVWTLAAALILLAVTYWLARERKRASDRCHRTAPALRRRTMSRRKTSLVDTTMSALRLCPPHRQQGNLKNDSPCRQSVQENNITYRLCVFLQPPPRHSFIPELDTTGQVPASSSSIHVVLECTCLRDEKLGESSCFHHHPDDKLPRDQSSFLLHTLCTHSHLGMEKVACWVQSVVRSA